MPFVCVHTHISLLGNFDSLPASAQKLTIKDIDVSVPNIRGQMLSAHHYVRMLTMALSATLRAWSANMVATEV